MYTGIEFEFSANFRSWVGETWEGGIERRRDGYIITKYVFREERNTAIGVCDVHTRQVWMNEVVINCGRERLPSRMSAIDLESRDEIFRRARGRAVVRTLCKSRDASVCCNCVHDEWRQARLGRTDSGTASIRQHAAHYGCSIVVLNVEINILKTLKRIFNKINK